MNKSLLSLGFCINANSVTIAETQRLVLMKHMDVLCAAVWQTLGQYIVCGLCFSATFKLFLTEFKTVLTSHRDEVTWPTFLVKSLFIKVKDLHL